MNKPWRGRVAHVDLTARRTEIEELDEAFLRTYPGGSSLAAYYLWRELKPGVDPLGEDNVLVFATGALTGLPVSGLSRYSICAKSPLSGLVRASEAGGYWGPQLKRAGFDALVVRGRASSPVYLHVHDGRVEVRDATPAWGMDTGAMEDWVRRDLGTDAVRVLGIGPAGENLVRFAAILSDLRHANGRGGLGAVMGAKRLKAVAVGGREPIVAYRPEEIREIARWGAERARSSPRWARFARLGTAGAVTAQDAAGGLPTRNFQRGRFAGAEAISGEALERDFLRSRHSCFGCVLRCKRVAAGSPYGVDPRYGGPEYETLAALGSYLEVADLGAICKGHELCNRLGLDTISAGGTLAWAMEARERGLLRLGRGDPDLRFGSAGAMLAALESIAYRRGVGDLLAEGSARAARKLGGGSERFAVHTRGVELPAHSPAVKKGLGLTYAVHPTGADHNASGHDPLLEVRSPQVLDPSLTALGILKPLSAQDLGPDKVRFIAYTQMYAALLDSLCLCLFCWGPGWLYPPDQLVRLVRAATGWETSLWELLKVGERTLNLLRLLAAREGSAAGQDVLPPRLCEEQVEGRAVVPEEFQQALVTYYGMMGWDENTGVPRPGKLVELGLGDLLEA